MTRLGRFAKWLAIILAVSLVMGTLVALVMFGLLALSDHLGVRLVPIVAAVGFVTSVAGWAWMLSKEEE